MRTETFLLFSIIIKGLKVQGPLILGPLVFPLLWLLYGDSLVFTHLPQTSAAPVCG